MKYSATLLSPQFESGRKAGELEIGFNKIIFKFDGGVVEWSLFKVKVAPGGAANQNVFFTNIDHPELSVYTYDKKVLKDPNLTSESFVSSQVTKANRHFLNKRIAIIIAVAILLLPIALFFVFRGEIVKLVAKQVPTSFEQKMGDKLFWAVSKGYQIEADSILNLQFNEVVKPLLNVVEDTSFHFSFYIISDTTVNAFALPGGKVVINSGLIAKADSWDEVLGVVAHEMRHVTARHHLRGVIGNVGVFYTITFLLGDYSGALGQMAAVGANLESLMYSRGFELEADNGALTYLEKANINPLGMKLFFEKLNKMEGAEKSSPYFSLISTHPATAERIANLEKQIKPLSIESKYSVDFKVFQQTLLQEVSLVEKSGSF